MRQAGEPFASTVVAVGFAETVRIYVSVARRIVESHPDVAGETLVRGTRDEGALWLVGEEAERELGESAARPKVAPSAVSVAVAVRIFSAIAFRHPFFDGNKRTGFLAALLVGQFMGLVVRDFPLEGAGKQLTGLTAREATDAELKSWFLRKVFIAPGTEGEVVP